MLSYMTLQEGYKAPRLFSDVCKESSWKDEMWLYIENSKIQYGITIYNIC